MQNSVVSILGCGWLGKQLGTKLVNSGYLVMGSTTKKENTSTLEAAGIVPFVFDVKGLSEYIHPFLDCDVLVVSLPQRARQGKAEEYIRQIEMVTKAAQRGNVGGIIMISTTSVYPNLNRVVMEGDADERNPVVQAERIIGDSGISNTVLRFGGLFGPGRHPGRFLAMRQNIPGARVPVNMIHVEDCIEIIKLVIHHNVWNEVLNACADDHPTKREFYTNAAIEIGMRPPVFSNDQVDYKIVSNERLKRVLNYRFTHRLT